MTGCPFSLKLIPCYSINNSSVGARCPGHGFEPQRWSNTRHGHTVSAFNPPQPRTWRPGNQGPGGESGPRRAEPRPEGLHLGPRSSPTSGGQRPGVTTVRLNDGPGAGLGFAGGFVLRGERGGASCPGPGEASGSLPGAQRRGNRWAAGAGSPAQRAPGGTVTAVIPPGGLGPPGSAGATPVPWRSPWL